MTACRTFARQALCVAAFLPCSLAAQTCSVAASAPAFGPYDGTEIASVGNVTVICVGTTTSVQYAIHLGTSASTNGGQRRMSRGASSLRYNFYCEGHGAQPWFDGAGSCRVSGSFPLTKSHPVYGRVPADQSVLPGTYTDLVPVVILY